MMKTDQINDDRTSHLKALNAGNHHEDEINDQEILPTVEMKSKYE